jgi:hypothetical protein
MQKHPKQMQSRVFVPALFVSGLGSPDCRLRLRHPDAISVGREVILYLGASAAAAVNVARKKACLELAPLVMLSFGVLHFAYGAGFLVGLIVFAAAGERPRSR